MEEEINPYKNTTIAERESMNNRDMCRVCSRYKARSRGRCSSCDYKNLQPLR